MFKMVKITAQVREFFEANLTDNNADVSTRREFWRMVNRKSAYARDGIYRDMTFTDHRNGVRYEVNGEKRGLGIQVWAMRVSAIA